MLEVEASFDFPWNFFFFKRANPGSVTTHGWESQKPKKRINLALWYLVLKMAETHTHKVQH